MLTSVPCTFVALFLVHVWVQQVGYEYIDTGLVSGRLLS